VDSSVELIFRGSEAVIGVGLLVAGGGVIALCYVHSIGWLVEAVCSFRLLRSKMQPTLRPLRSLGDLPGFARVAAPFFVSFRFLYLFAQAGLVGLTQLLERRIKTHRRMWWLASVVVVVAMAATARTFPLPDSPRVPLALAVGVVLSWMLRVITRPELEAIFSRVGVLRSTATKQ
jgi:hypothetical protein